MKQLSLLFSLLLLSTALFGSATLCPNIYYNSEAPDILNTKLEPKTKELCYTAFAVMHSGVSRTPLWSAEHLTREALRKKIKRSNDFHEEDQLERNERAELNDYAHSGFDRGHLAPSADMPTKSAQHECFTLANMVPQNSENNRGIWSAIEISTRDLAKAKGELYVITGPLFIGSSLGRLKGRVLIPTKIYKAIYDPASQKGAAYITDNASGDDYKVISIMELEQLSGIRFFPKMTPSEKQTVLDLPDPEVRYSRPHHAKSDLDIVYLLKKLFNGRW